MRCEFTRQDNAAKVIHEVLRRLMDDRPGPLAMALLINKAALALNEIMDARITIEHICKKLMEDQEK